MPLDYDQRERENQLSSWERTTCVEGGGAMEFDVVALCKRAIWFLGTYYCGQTGRPSGRG